MTDDWIDWKGSHDGEHDGPVPPHLWPYGPPSAHQQCCRLHEGGNACDCAASDASDTEWGAQGAPMGFRAGLSR
jgi:hypothetical protein